MNEHNEGQQKTLWLITKALYMASAVGFGLILISLPALFLSDTTHAIHNAIIPMERMAYNTMMFRLFGEMKILLIVCLLCPAIGLHWALARDASRSKV